MSLKNIVGKSLGLLGLEKFLMVVGVLLCLIGLLSNFLSGIPIIGGLFAVSSSIIFGLLLIIIVIIGVL